MTHTHTHAHRCTRIGPCQLETSQHPLPKEPDTKCARAMAELPGCSEQLNQLQKPAARKRAQTPDPQSRNLKKMSKGPTPSWEAIPTANREEPHRGMSRIPFQGGTCRSQGGTLQASQRQRFAYYNATLNPDASQIQSPDCDFAFHFSPLLSGHHI